MPLLRFVVLNVVGAALWVVLISGAGYAFGLAINSLVDDLKRIEETVLVVILAFGVVLWLWRRFRIQTWNHAGMERRWR